MDDADEQGDDIVEILTSLRSEMKKIQGKVGTLERYLREEGFGEELDDDDDDTY